MTEPNTKSKKTRPVSWAVTHLPSLTSLRSRICGYTSTALPLQAMLKKLQKRLLKKKLPKKLLLKKLPKKLLKKLLKKRPKKLKKLQMKLPLTLRKL